MKRILIGLAIAAAVCLGTPTLADPASNPQVLTQCGVTKGTYVAGEFRAPSQNLLGQNCPAGASQYPDGAIPETISATGTTTATTATLATASGKTTYLCGFSIRANATAAATAQATVTGVITGTMSFLQWTAPLASNIGLNEQRFNPCIPASAANQAIAVVSAAPGSGGNVSVSAWGFKL